MNRPRFVQPDRAVVKIGSSSLRTERGELDRRLATAVVDQLAEVSEAGTEVVLVSSGAVAAGLRPLGLTRRPSDLPRLQAAASVGQGLLLHTYRERFAKHGLACGQVLLTPDDVVDRARYLNARHTFEALLTLGAVPIVNENDTVATEELRFGDNDRLAALVASMLGAQLLVLLTDVEGLLDADGQVLDTVEDLNAVTVPLDRRPGSEVGSGGIASKLEAARIAMFSGTGAVIAPARRPGVIGEVLAGGGVGTWFPPLTQRPESRKLWIAFARTPRGVVSVDAGAVRALVDRGSSLLPVGVTGAAGSFRAGDAVDVVGPDGGVVARGLVGYDRDGIEALRADAGSSRQAQAPVIHRNQLVVL